MKTISQIAKELSVSRQAVYKKVNNHSTGDLQGHLHKQNGSTTMIDSEGEKILRKLFSSTIYKSGTPSNNQVVTILHDQLLKKDEQIQKKDEQIATLLKQMEHLHVLIKQEQEMTTELIGENQKLLDQKQTPFINKLFKKKGTS